MHLGESIKKTILTLLLTVSLSLISATKLGNQAIATDEVVQRPRAIFYLNASPGCYSRSFIQVTQIPFGDVKKLYRTSCEEPHHFEVFFVGMLSKADRSISRSTDNSVQVCSKEYSKLKFNSRNSRSYNWSNNETLTYGNWLADRGPEEKRFGLKFICYASLGVKDLNFYKEIDSPLIRGFGKIEK